MGVGNLTSISSAVAALIARFLPFGMVGVPCRFLRGKAAQGRTAAVVAAQATKKKAKKNAGQPKNLQGVPLKKLPYQTGISLRWNCPPHGPHLPRLSLLCVNAAEGQR